MGRMTDLEHRRLRIPCICRSGRMPIVVTDTHWGRNQGFSPDSCGAPRTASLCSRRLREHGKPLYHRSLLTSHAQRTAARTRT